VKRNELAVDGRGNIGGGKRRSEERRSSELHPETSRGEKKKRLDRQVRRPEER